jgi:hypothetical protein
MLIWEDQENATQLYRCGISKLDAFDFANWTKNRPPDMVRVRQIVEYYKLNNTKLVPGIVYTWRHPEKRKSIVYDGIHRLLAAFQVEHPMDVLIQIKNTNKEQEIIDDFININKSVSVPSIYLEDTDTLKKTVCLTVAEEICKRYPNFVSPSRKPYVYNFNRDNLIEFVSSWSINFARPNVQHLILEELVKLNREAKAYVHKMNIPHPKKCSFHEFFLFFLEKDRIRSRMEDVLR